MAGSDYAENFCREAFRYHGYVTKYGSPRNDIFFQCNEKDVARIKTKIGIGANTKIVLFAPTFHDNNVLAKKNEQVTVDFNRLLSALECKYGGDWVCLVRAHVCSLGLDLNISDKRIIDVTQYFDMADLLLVSDWLLSDYSSSLGDFILTGRPAVLLDFNRQNYIKSRELDVDIDKVGYKIAHNQKELEDIVNNTSLEEFSKCCDEVKKYYGVHESGEAASRICEYIKTEGDKARKKNLQ
jgi:CDP-glycerol glycerophosphotransferase